MLPIESYKTLLLIALLRKLVTASFISSLLGQFLVPAKAAHFFVGTQMARELRSYEGAWLQLKQKKILAITAPVPVHKTIIRMMRKEKNMDAEYKFLLAEANLRAKLTVTVQGSKLVFKLTEELTAFGI